MSCSLTRAALDLQLVSAENAAPGLARRTGRCGTNGGSSLSFQSVWNPACAGRLGRKAKEKRRKRSAMAESSRQKRVAGRVMHEFKHGELKSGRGGKGGKVKSRRQAIAIALREAGASKYDSARRNRRDLRKTENKETKGRTAQQEREGKSHVGASRAQESTRAMGGRNARKQTARGHRAAVARARK